MLAIFGPEITQQLSAQHLSDTVQQTARIDSAANHQIAVLMKPVTAAQHALETATRNANTAHQVYICELTGNCHLAQGEVTGVPGAGPQAAQDRIAWQNALAQQARAQQAVNTTSATEAVKAAALRTQAGQEIGKATATIDADSGLLARERALDTLSRQNPGFLLRRVLLWLALMFIDLAPVLLKTFSPGTLAVHLQRSDAIRLARNAMPDAVADSDHESAKRAITREHDLEYHRMLVQAEYQHRMEEARAGLLLDGTDPFAVMPNGATSPNGRHRAPRHGAGRGDRRPAGGREPLAHSAAADRCAALGPGPGCR